MDRIAEGPILDESMMKGNMTRSVAKAIPNDMPTIAEIAVQQTTKTPK